jgi:hypothetical protein
MLWFIRMKKLFLFLITFFASLLFTNVFAATWQTASGWILFRFCDDWLEQDKLKMELNLIAKPWDQQNICLLFYNSNSNNSLTFDYWFSSAFINSRNIQLCDSDIWTGNKFSKLFLNDKKRNYTLKPWESIILKETIVPPLWMSWIQYGCLVRILANTWNNSGMFKIVKRNASIMKVFVWWESEIKNSIDFVSIGNHSFVLDKKVGYIYENNMLKLLFAVKNNWNVSHSFVISWMIYNILWFQKDFSVVGNHIAPGQTVNLDVNVGIIPFYKWFFSVIANLDSTPIYEFDVSNLDKKFLEHTILQQTWSFFIFSRIWIILFVAVATFLLKLFWPRKRSVV